jgi:hypothetical protein
MSSTSPASNPTATAPVDAARATAGRLREWLLQGPAQLRSGDEAGGVAGTIGADGTPRYVYAEITGYYLSWLADVAMDDATETMRERARLALTWAMRGFGRTGSVLQTRIHLDGGDHDWRNDAIFFFDLAMLLRGVDAAAEARLVDDPTALRAALHAHLLQFVDGGALRAAIQFRGVHPLPARWSTLGGPFLVKASSRTAWSDRHARLPEALARACARDSDTWAPRAADIDLDMLHPTLYFAEGLLLSRPDRADAIAALLDRCLALTLADGSLPETSGERTAANSDDVRVRNDIIAQALRVALLLHELGAKGAPEANATARLATTLLDRIGDRDFVCFNAESGAQANVWCTMFAEQALRWYAGVASNDAQRPSAAALV